MPKLKETEDQKKDRMLAAIIAKNMTLYGYTDKKELALLLRMNRSSFYRKLRGDSDFTKTELRRLFRVLKFTPEEKEAVL